MSSAFVYTVLIFLLFCFCTASLCLPDLTCISYKLQMQENVRLEAEQLFEYFLNNHLVIPEPVDILHAFNIALVRNAPIQCLCCCFHVYIYQLC